jgi:hypothetical protein
MRVAVAAFVMVLTAGQAAAEDRFAYSVGFGVTFHVDKLNYGSAEREKPEVVRLGIWSPSGRYHAAAMLVPENSRKGVEIPTTAYFTLQRVFHWRRWGPVVPYYGLGVALATRTTPLEGSLANFANSLGVQYVPAGKDWFVELVYHHLSNADLTKPNFGVDVLAMQFNWTPGRR